MGSTSPLKELAGTGLKNIQRYVGLFMQAAFCHHPQTIKPNTWSQTYYFKLACKFNIKKTQLVVRK